MPKKKTTSEFIADARKVHGDKYDYSKVEYKGTDKKVCIICPEHGEFWQAPHGHLTGQGCQDCSKKKMGKYHESNTEAFIERARIVHGDRFDYSKADYLGCDKKICIICPEHGEFWPTPNNFLRGSGCPSCSGHARITQTSFIERASKKHGDKYDYSKVEVVDVKTKICIICPEHGEFFQTLGAHLNGAGCPRCNKSFKLTTETFIEKAQRVHGERYDYSSVEYINARTPIKIICREHGIFVQNPRDHLNGANCPKCSRRFMDTVFFIENAQKKHGKKYDYSLVEYTSSHDSVKIVCPEHGKYRQLAYQHLAGSGCPICAQNYCPTTEEFVARVSRIHQNEDGSPKYDYSKVVYLSSKEAVCIICPEHGGFMQSPNTHLRGCGCPSCAGRFHYTTQDFVALAKDVHGDKYDYSETEYIKSQEKVRIICPEHGEFWQTACVHLQGSGCPKCSTGYHYDTQEFVRRAKEIHKTDDGSPKYDYSLTTYRSSNEKVRIICPIHGEFEQIAIVHLNGSGCSKCKSDKLAKLFLGNKEDFVAQSNKVHKGKYDYSFVDYQGNKKKVTIVCPIHGAFQQTPNNHMRGAGCPVCNERRLEKDVRNLLDAHKVRYEFQKNFPWLMNKGNLTLDFYLPDQNIAIECQGRQHVQSVDFFGGDEGLADTIERDLTKRVLCEEQGIPVIYYSDLDLDFPYPVVRNLPALLKRIMSFSIGQTNIWNAQLEIRFED